MSNLSIKERPILFSGPMVRAILDGSKTQTRRKVANFQQPVPAVGLVEFPEHRYSAIAQNHLRWGFSVFGETEQACADALAESGCCPYGRVGNQLWVRETWQFYDWTDEGEPCVRFAVDNAMNWFSVNDETIADQWEILSRPENFDIDNHARDRRWRPSIHMPRWANRIQLEITGTRVERLQGIAEQDCRAEGAHGGHGSIPGYSFSATPLEHFQHIWKSTGGDWGANPWVWVIEFRRIKP